MATTTVQVIPVIREMPSVVGKRNLAIPSSITLVGRNGVSGFENASPSELSKMEHSQIHRCEAAKVVPFLANADMRSDRKLKPLN